MILKLDNNYRLVVQMNREEVEAISKVNWIELGDTTLEVAFADLVNKCRDLLKGDCDDSRN